ncbi:hypothetical protein OIY81_2813 [Cryptosporidium canis]|nr:hypothetical protein OIY81_2813 [Cryptosporidium canis]
MVDGPVEFEYLRYKDGPDVPMVENPHYFALIRFLGLIGSTSMAIEWSFEDIQAAFESEELTEYSKSLHLKLLGFLGKRFPPHVTLERNLTKFLDERPIDVSVIFWDKIGQNVSDVDHTLQDGLDGDLTVQDDEGVKLESADGVKGEAAEVYKEDPESYEVLLYNPYRDREYRDVQSYERLRTIRILINTCIQESKQLRSAFQRMDNYSMRCKNVVPGECFFGSSPPYIGDDQLGHHYWYINHPDDEVIFKLYRESSLTGELTLLSDNSDTLCSTFKTFLNSEDLHEIGQKLEVKYNALVVAEKAKLRKIRQMRSIRNQLESSWGNCAPTDEMLSGGRAKRKAAMNVDYSYSRSESATRRSTRLNRNSYDSDSFGYDQNQVSSSAVRDRSDRLAIRNAKKQQIEESEKDQERVTESKDHEALSDKTRETEEDKSHTCYSNPDDVHGSLGGDSAASSQTPVLPPLAQPSCQAPPLAATATNLPNHTSLWTAQGSPSPPLQSTNLAPNPISMQPTSGVIPTTTVPPHAFPVGFPAHSLSQIHVASQLPQVSQVSQAAYIPQIHPAQQIPQVSNIQAYGSLSGSPVVGTGGSTHGTTHNPSLGTHISPPGYFNQS